MKEQKLSKRNLKQTISILITDHLFLLLIIANILVMFIYAHSESSLIQYLTQAKTTDLNSLITALVVTNAVTIVVFQFPLLRLMKNININHRVYVGLLLFFASQTMFALSSTESYWSWIVSVFVLSLGEAILFPTMNIQVDRLAPAHLRGSYFGATSLYSLGWSAAPIVGGLMIDYYSGQALYILTSLTTVVVFWLYLISKYLRRPDFSSSNLLLKKVTSG